MNKYKKKICLYVLKSVLAMYFWVIFIYENMFYDVEDYMIL